MNSAGQPQRCAWVPLDDPLYVAYHDREWGHPSRDEGYLFEKLCLEAFQAGLSWRIVLHRREAFRRAFEGFDPERVAAFGPEKLAALATDPGIIRNRAKIAATVHNAARYLALKEKFGGLHAYLWRFVEGRPVVGNWRSVKEIPARTPLAERVSRDLKQNGFKFVGATMIYAYLQSVGVVNDHTVDCFRHAELVG